MKNTIINVTILVLCIGLNVFQKIHADLLTGPYSAESSELVKMTLNPALPVPEKYKGIISDLRTIFDGQQLDGHTNSMFHNIVYDANKMKDTMCIEALVQLILIQKPKLPSVSTIGAGNEDYKYLIAYVALNIGDFNLLKSILKNTSIELKNELLYGEFLREIDENDTAGLMAIKKRLKALIDNGANINAKDTYSGQPIITEENNYELLVFLIEQGLDVNAIIHDNITRLDYLRRQQAFQHSTPERRINKQKIIDLVVSKGGKTYSELIGASH